MIFTKKILILLLSGPLLMGPQPASSQSQLSISSAMSIDGPEGIRPRLGAGFHYELLARHPKRSVVIGAEYDYLREFHRDFIYITVYRFYNLDIKQHNLSFPVGLRLKQINTGSELSLDLFINSDFILMREQYNLGLFNPGPFGDYTDKSISTTPLLGFGGSLGTNYKFCTSKDRNYFISCHYRYAHILEGRWYRYANNFIRLSLGYQFPNK